jgi:hypothetical protein
MQGMCNQAREVVLFNPFTIIGKADDLGERIIRINGGIIYHISTDKYEKYLDRNSS